MKQNDKTKLRAKIAKQLAVERLFAQISQEELAQRVGTQKSNISRIENGRQNISVDYIQAIAEALGKEAKFALEEPGFDYGDDTEYSLKLYDEELLRFRLHKEIGLRAEILWVNEERRHMLPLDLELDEDGLLKWLERRVIPANRELVGQILGSLGLDVNSLKGIIDVCMGLSLNDSYWVPQSDFEGTFREYNLYENPFTTALSLIAYTGIMHDTSKFRTSPELTTGGMLRKAWRFSKSKGIWLYKGGTFDYANAGNEPYSEFYASQIAERMGLHAVQYELENWKGILASKCKLFTDIDTAYIPIGRIVRTGGIDACIEFYKDLGDSFYQELASRLVFDAVILNEDRHFGNFGVLRDNHSGEIISPAPVFDNGLSLLCYAMQDDFDNIDTYIGTRSNPYGRDYKYMKLAVSVMGPLQKEQLRKLINFTFKESDVCNLPSWRTRALEEIIQKRVRELLSM